MRHNVLFYGLKKRGNSKHFRDFRLLTLHMRDLKLWSWSIFRSSFSECIICEDCCYLNPTVAHSLPEYRWISNSENFIFSLVWHSTQHEIQSQKCLCWSASGASDDCRERSKVNEIYYWRQAFVTWSNFIWIVWVLLQISWFIHLHIVDKITIFLITFCWLAIFNLRAVSSVDSVG